MPNPYDLMSMLFGPGQTTVQYPGPPQTMQNNSDSERQRLLDIMFNTQAQPVPEERKGAQYYIGMGLASLGDALARAYGSGQGGNAIELVQAMRERRRQKALEREDALAQQKRSRAAIEYSALEDKQKISAEQVFRKEQQKQQYRANWEDAALKVGANVTPDMTDEQIKAAVFEEAKRRKDWIEEYKTDNQKLVDEKRKLELRLAETEANQARYRLEQSKKSPEGVQEDRTLYRQMFLEIRKADSQARGMLGAVKDAANSMTIQGKPTTPEEIRQTFFDDLDALGLDPELYDDPKLQKEVATRRNILVMRFIDEIEPKLQQAEKPGLQDGSGKGLIQWLKDTIGESQEAADKALKLAGLPTRR